MRPQNQTIAVMRYSYRMAAIEEFLPHDAAVSCGRMAAARAYGRTLLSMQMKLPVILLLDLTRFGPNRVAADMEGNGGFDFWVIFGAILEEFWRFFEEFWRNWFIVRRRKNFHQLETNKENEVLRPLWPPNSLGGHI